MKKVMAYFGKAPDPKELVRKWQSTCRSEMRSIDRQIREIQREEKKVEKSIKECAKRQDISSAKAQLNSVSMKLGETLAMVRAVGHLEQSTEVMATVNQLIKVPEIQKVMQEMSKEMMKAGMIEEFVSDTLDEVLDEDGMEEETEAEVDKVLREVAGEALANLPGTEAAATKQAAAEVQRAQAQQEEDEMRELQERLNAVRAA